MHCINAVTVKMKLAGHGNDSLVCLTILLDEGNEAVIRLLIAVDEQDFETMSPPVHVPGQYCPYGVLNLLFASGGAVWG